MLEIPAFKIHHHGKFTIINFKLIMNHVFHLLANTVWLSLYLILVAHTGWSLSRFL